MKKRLKEGFTTGTAAAAGAKAALLAIKGIAKSKVDTPLPTGKRLEIPIHHVEIIRQYYSKAVVIKDGGDDPDVTHNAKIITKVSIFPEENTSIAIEGGKGVGKVTKQGLPVPVGEWAINPTPRAQIKEAVKEALEITGLKGRVKVVIEVENGEKIAKKTLNPKLGIVGGISILGTRGTVKPFSHRAYKDTIKLCLDMAKKENPDIIALCTGGRSERFLKKTFPLPDTCYVQVADFFAFSIKEAKLRKFKTIVFGSFFGKLVKIAQKNPYTHARVCDINFSLLTEWCAKAGLEKEKCPLILNCNTANQALEIILGSKKKEQITNHILKEALIFFKKFIDDSMNVYYYLFLQDGTLLKKMDIRWIKNG